MLRELLPLRTVDLSVFFRFPGTRPLRTPFDVQRSDSEISVELANGGGKVTVSATLEREGDLENVKLRNLDYSRWDTKGRGGVDDLTALTHLHEPAILDVLVSTVVRISWIRA